MSFVDLMGDVVYAQAQIERRITKMLNKDFSSFDIAAMNDMAIGIALGRYTPSAAETTAIDSYEARRLELRTEREEATADNVLLVSTIGYERAQREAIRLNLKINGRVAVPEQLEIVDPETYEVLQEYASAVTAIEPLPETAVSADLDGNPINIPNPEKYDAQIGALALLAAAQATIADASQEVLDLATQRAVV